MALCRIVIAIVFGLASGVLFGYSLAKRDYVYMFLALMIYTLGVIIRILMQIIIMI